MRKNLLIIGLLLIAVLFNSQMDKINFTHSGWFIGWWTAQNWQQPVWQKYLLGWTVDGWHFCKIIVLTAFISAIVISNRLRLYWIIILLIGWGILFEVFYAI